MRWLTSRHCRSGRSVFQVMKANFKVKNFIGFNSLCLDSFRDFLKRAADYGLHTIQATQAVEASNSSDPMASLTRTVLSRNQKLEKYRQQKELEDEINKLKVVMKEQEKIDDETEREFYVKLLKMSVIDAQDELASIEQEKQILAYQKSRGEMSADERNVEDKKVVAPKPLKPVIITKDLAQKAVYGLGYPSLPTMTVQDFYDERVREKFFPDPKMKVTQSANVPVESNEESLEDIQREEKLDQDDEYERARLMAKDEFKDDHRRGEGNRYNRS